MASRRQLMGAGGEREGAEDEFDFGGFADSFMGGGSFDSPPPMSEPPAPPPMTGGYQPDPLSPGTDRAPGFFLLSPEEQQAIRDFEKEQGGGVAGDQQTARMIGGWNRPNQPITRPNEPQLPQAVSVEERSGPEQTFTNDTPAQPFSPSPVAASTPEPMQTAGPQRRTLSNATPALFAESGGARMFGDADGLMGGGRGMVGSNAGGPTPTEMMLSIMRQLKGGV